MQSKMNLGARLLPIFFLFSMSFNTVVFAQKGDTTMSQSTFSGITFRSIGPAFMSGRIADIAINPNDDNQWYLAVGSGGVWKTNNAGVTWKAIFEKESSYSIGCVSIDPSNTTTIWVGTGENIGGRHVGYGDGIYKSDDGGQSWKNMGLKESQHISRIVIHPENPDVVWVAAQGPLWNSGGERGVYKTDDGGKTWKQVLGDSEWVGATDLVIDPRDPKRLYAATWQRHRNVAAYMGGGPGTAIYSTTDGGETWQKLSKGLPASNMGKIGLAISPQQPDILYAAIELDRRTGAVYKSTDRGASWTQQSKAVSGATGPHYYQELYASPHSFDRIYLMDVRIQVSDDGGKTFRVLKEGNKHSDNHAIAFRADDPDYLLVGTDGGLYESFDLAAHWRYMNNLPLTQYYKVAVDDATPFYNVYGGTQDNNTQVGPSRTLYRHGASNADWRIVLFADGHQPATEPGNPNIAYAEAQEGFLYRIDRSTGEVIPIQPQPGMGEGPERFNWDSPILISPHSPTRLYFASQRLWRSEDRGDSWEAISGDLTRNEERITLPIMGKTWSWDSPWDMYAMSTYNTITSIAESPKQSGLIYIGTDDGLIQVTEDGGKNWKKMEVGSLPGVPKTAFVNDIKADLFDANTVYIVLDNHKFGDLNPYVFKSTDRGKSWKSIKANIPERTLVWRIVQDYKNPKLLFLATEFGIYFSIDGAEKWVKFTGGLPTIPFRDLAIQRRENDLVGASFGRGFYILDDYSFLREVDETTLQEEATLFPVKDALWYIPEPVFSFGKEQGSQGDMYFTSENPPDGATFTFYLKESYESSKQIRKKAEAKLTKEGKGVEFPGWEAVEKEKQEKAPCTWLIISDTDGNVIRKVKGPATRGFHRVSWDLRYPSTSAMGSETLTYGEGWRENGMLVQPGMYQVTLYKEVDGSLTTLSQPMPFNVVPLRQGALPSASSAQLDSYWQDIADMNGKVSALNQSLRKATTRVGLMQKALSKTPLAPSSLDSSLNVLRKELLALDVAINGSKSKQEIGEKAPPTINERLNFVRQSTTNSTYGPTPNILTSLNIVKEEYQQYKLQLEEIILVKMPPIEKALQEAGAPWIEGQDLPD